MEFRTEITPAASRHTISHQDKILLIGSCFTEHIGSWLEELFFDVCLNPSGIVYNPESAAYTLERLLSGKSYGPEELFQTHGIYHSFDHHSRFSSASAEEMLMRINESQRAAADYLLRSKYLLVTFGTSWIYRLKENGAVVSNCHKLPEKLFERQRLSENDIVSRWESLIQKIRESNPQIRILFTVSPIRHIKDTLHGNQLSKAVLLLAIDRLCAENEECEYFPSYELLMDDLRDYRFYKEDMVHPSETAVRYIRDKFADTYFTPATRKLIKECIKIQKALTHRPLHPESEAYKRFLTQNIQSIEHLIEKNHFFTFERTLTLFKDRLKAIENPVIHKPQ